MNSLNVPENTEVVHCMSSSALNLILLLIQAKDLGF